MLCCVINSLSLLFLITLLKLNISSNVGLFLYVTINFFINSSLVSSIFGKYDKNVPDYEFVFHPMHIMAIIKRPRPSNPTREKEEDKLYAYWSEFIDTLNTLYETSGGSSTGGKRKLKK